MLNELQEKRINELRIAVNNLTVEELEESFAKSVQEEQTEKDSNKELTRAIAITMYKQEEARKYLAKNITDDFLREAVMADVPVEALVEGYDKYQRIKNEIEQITDDKVKADYLLRRTSENDFTKIEANLCKDILSGMIDSPLQRERVVQSLTDDYKTAKNKPVASTPQSTQTTQTVQTEPANETAQYTQAIPTTQVDSDVSTDQTPKIERTGLDKRSIELIEEFAQNNFELSDEERAKMEECFNLYKVVINRTEPEPTTLLERLLVQSRIAFAKVTVDADEYCKRGKIDLINKDIVIEPKPEDTSRDILKSLIYCRALSLSTLGHKSTNEGIEPATGLHKEMAKTFAELVMDTYTEKEEDKIDQAQIPQQSKTTIIPYNAINTIMLALTLDDERDKDLKVIKNWFVGDQTDLRSILATETPYDQGDIKIDEISETALRNFILDHRKELNINSMAVENDYQTEKQENLGDKKRLNRLGRMKVYLARGDVRRYYEKLKRERNEEGTPSDSVGR